MSILAALVVASPVESFVPVDSHCYRLSNRPSSQDQLSSSLVYHLQEHDPIQLLVQARFSIPKSNQIQNSRSNSLLVLKSATGIITLLRIIITLLSMTSHLLMAEPDGYTVPRWGPYPSETPEQATIRRSCVVTYALVWIYPGTFARGPTQEDPLGLVFDKITIMAYPPDANDNENDQARHDILYSYGDPHKWTPVLTCTGSGSVDDPFKFEMRINERDFVAEQSNYEGPRTLALEALKMLDDESNFIVKDPSGDVILDDNGNKMLFMKILVPELEPWEPWVFQFKKIVHGQETILTEREKKRLRFYLAEAYDG